VSSRFFPQSLEVAVAALLGFVGQVPQHTIAMAGSRKQPRETLSTRRT